MKFLVGFILIFTSSLSFSKTKTIEVMASCNTSKIEPIEIKNYLNMMVEDSMVSLKNKKISTRAISKSNIHRFKFVGKKLKKFLETKDLTLGEFSHEFSTAFAGECDLMIPNQFSRRKTKRNYQRIL